MVGACLKVEIEVSTVANKRLDMYIDTSCYCILCGNVNIIMTSSAVG